MMLDQRYLSVLRNLAAFCLILLVFEQASAQDRSGISMGALIAFPTGLQLPAMIKGDSPIQIEKGGGSYLGVFLGDVNEDRAKILQMAEVRGALVGKVEEGSPAAKAGLLENDVILAFNDKKVLNRAQFFILLIESAPGSKVQLGIRRKGDYRIIPVELGYRRTTALIDHRQQITESVVIAHPGATRQVKSEDDKITLLPLQQTMASASRFYLGVNTMPLSEQLAKYFNVARGGVLVTETTVGSLSERAGVKAGDCIIKINDDSVSSISDLNLLVERLFMDRVLNNQPLSNNAGNGFSLTIVREGNEQKINMTFDQR
jgi:S1-C subfamily serine protease